MVLSSSTFKHPTHHYHNHRHRHHHHRHHNHHQQQQQQQRQKSSNNRHHSPIAIASIISIVNNNDVACSYGSSWQYVFIDSDNGMSPNWRQAIIRSNYIGLVHDDVIKWKHFPCYWLFAWGIYRSTMDSSHKDQWRGALIFSYICAWTNGLANSRGAGDVMCLRTHYDVTVMSLTHRYFIRPLCAGLS